MPPVFWLAHVLATESEGRLKEASAWSFSPLAFEPLALAAACRPPAAAVAIMSLKSSVYYAANAATYVAASAVGWLLVTVIFTFLVR